MLTGRHLLGWVVVAVVVDVVASALNVLAIDVASQDSVADASLQAAAHSAKEKVHKTILN